MIHLLQLRSQHWYIILTKFQTLNFTVFWINILCLLQIPFQAPTFRFVFVAGSSGLTVSQSSLVFFCDFDNPEKLASYPVGRVCLLFFTWLCFGKDTKEVKCPSCYIISGVGGILKRREVKQKLIILSDVSYVLFLLAVPLVILSIWLPFSPAPVPWLPTFPGVAESSDQVPNNQWECEGWPHQPSRDSAKPYRTEGNRVSAPEFQTQMAYSSNLSCCKLTFCRAVLLLMFLTSVAVQ